MGSKLFFILFCVITILSVAGCTYIKKDMVQSQASCIITNAVSYNLDVAPIIKNNCAQCHSTASNNSGLLLDNYNAVKFYGFNGHLYGTITHSPGFIAMPDDVTKISDCSIAIIKKWIDNGAPEN